MGDQTPENKAERTEEDAKCPPLASVSLDTGAPHTFILKCMNCTHTHTHMYTHHFYTHVHKKIESLNEIIFLVNIQEKRKRKEMEISMFTNFGLMQPS